MSTRRAGGHGVDPEPTLLGPSDVERRPERVSDGEVVLRVWNQKVCRTGTIRPGDPSFVPCQPWMGSYLGRGTPVDLSTDVPRSFPTVLLKSPEWVSLLRPVPTRRYGRRGLPQRYMVQ